MAVQNKVVVVGDGFVGKTSLLDTFVNGVFPTEHIPTIFDTMNKTVIDGTTETILNLWDTAGQEDYKGLMNLSFFDAKCFIMCYSIDRNDTLNNIHDVWMKEVRSQNTSAPIILVGTKCDIRADKGSYVTTNAGKKMQKKIRAYAFIECSAKTQTNIEEVFLLAAHALNTPVKSGCCTLL